ncbi:MAG: hypothetical protein K2X29_10335 [Candidatus Obscuribacterales bacterium]|nr:hypothetical protein [Candidatus Obscuribacterales bacterium]
MTNIKHPYWELYLQLADIKTSASSGDARIRMRQLAQKAGFSRKNLLLADFYSLLPIFGYSSIERLFFTVTREQFAYSVLSPEMLLRIAALSPLVELGAGNGYIAWLLQQMSVDIVPLDAFPVEEGKNWFFNTRFGLPAAGGQSWTVIEKGLPKDLSSHSERTLLLCWPPRNNMASEALNYYSGRKVAVISVRGCCASSAFYRKLNRNWTLEYSIGTGSWKHCHSEVLEVYSRPQEQ